MEAHSSKLEPPSGVFDEKMAEGVPASTALSNPDPKHLNIDTSAGVLRGSTTNSTRTPDTQVPEELRSQGYLRTLPRKKMNRQQLIVHNDLVLMKTFD